MNATVLVPSLLFLAIVTSGCTGGCDTTNEAGGQRVVCSSGGQFSYTRNGNMVSEQKEYHWENAKQSATVSVLFNGAESGTATVMIYDADGTTVYNKSHGHSGQSADNEPTKEGRPGTWTVNVNIGALNGQVAVNVRAGLADA